VPFKEIQDRLKRAVPLAAARQADSVRPGTYSGDVGKQMTVIAVVTGVPATTLTERASRRLPERPRESPCAR